MELTPEQSRAAQAVRGWLGSRGPSAFSLTGLAGTGKTTTIARMIGEEIPEATPVLALTGKATLALTRKGVAASTIHSAIYRAIESPAGVRWVKRRDFGDEPRPLAVIDEASMVNEVILNDLLDVFDRLLLVGDHGQLPPVEGRGVLERVGGFRLQRVLRQALDSGILRTAHALRNQEPLSRALAEGGDDVLRRLPQSGEIEGGAVWPLDEATLITARNVDRVYLNRASREAALGSKIEPLVVGDRIIALSNQPSGWVNGMVADVVSTGETQEDPNFGLHYVPFRARCDDGAEREGFALAEQLDAPKVRDDICRAVWREDKNIRHRLFSRGWCLTAHKAQGSEWRNVVVYGDGFGDPEARAAWRYTAATRAAERLFWVGA